MSLTRCQKKELLELARESVEKGESREDRKNLLFWEDPVFSGERAVFVTLTNAGELRGCIGHLYPRWSLWLAVARMAAEAATHDSRFSNIRPEEVEDLDIEISVLGIPEEIPKDPGAVRIGRDGLILEANGRRGVLLPQVASTRGWDAETFLEHLCRKAGLDREAWLEEDAKLYRFEAEVFGEED